jgi:hypothetical protein
LDGSVAMEKNQIRNKQCSVTSIKWLCAHCGNGWWRVPDDVLEEASAARYQMLPKKIKIT